MPILTFQQKPSNEALRQAVDDLGLGCYRFTGFSDDGLTYTVEAVDLWADLEAKRLRDGYHVCHVTVTCQYCQTVYKGWRKLSKKYYSAGPYYERVPYCPACPPISSDVWARQFVDLLEERPEPFTEARHETVPSRLTLDDDFD